MTPLEVARYARQLLLPEIGEAGQERILNAVAHVAGDGLAHDIARRYAERAGFAHIEPGEIAAHSDSIVVTPAAAQVLAGSRAALAAIRTTL